MDIRKFQKEIIEHKKKQGFNYTDINLEFLCLYGEVGEAYDAYSKKKPGLGGELADIAIYLCALSEMLGFDLEKEIKDKMEINKKRKYKMVDGVLLREKTDIDP
ncbi:MAG: hypothetical protein LBN07_00705 [Christensenellaceae bacterium]|nr:hypothetical protein [Christensenellaceae bacterium]